MAINAEDWVRVLNATFNDVSVIYWWSVLLVEEIGVSRENHQVSVKLYHKMLYRVHDHLTMSRIQTHNFSGDRH